MDITIYPIRRHGGRLLLAHRGSAPIRDLIANRHWEAKQCKNAFQKILFDVNARSVIQAIHFQDGEFSESQNKHFKKIYRPST
jgi:hypothetical protein